MEHNAFITLVKTAIEDLRKQGCQSKDPVNKTCLYNGPNGTCCIVGHMMPDQETREKADVNDDEVYGTAIMGLYHQDFPWATQFTFEQIRLLCDLQRCHDVRNDIWEASTVCSSMLDALQAWECGFTKAQIFFFKTKSKSIEVL